MNEVYRKKPSPPDWPMPAGIVQRQVDFTSNGLATPYCPAQDIVNEYYIPGTDPMFPCDIHTQFGLYPDTLGVYPPGVTVPGTGYNPRPVDTSYRSTTPANIGTPRPRDTTVFGRPVDTLNLSPVRMDTIRGRTGSVFQRDTTNRRIRPDTGRRPPDTIFRVRPDTVRPRVDTVRPRIDTVACCHR
jgi:penicillin-binding protein 1A